MALVAGHLDFSAESISVAAGSLYNDAEDHAGAEDGTVYLGIRPEGAAIIVR